MARFGRAGTILAVVGLGAALAACSSGNAGLSTGTLLGGSSNVPPPKPLSPAELTTSRALHAGATVARARRCGYVFDPAQVRAGYLAYEGTQATPADLLARAEKSYDYTVASVGKTIAENADYCSDAQTAIIKRDLGKLLAGDYSSPAAYQPPAAAAGWWGAPSTHKKFDREEALKTKDQL